MKRSILLAMSLLVRLARGGPQLAGQSRGNGAASGYRRTSPPLPRHAPAFASHALAAGLTAHAVAALLGHTDAGLVLRRYGTLCRTSWRGPARL